MYINMARCWAVSLAFLLMAGSVVLGQQSDKKTDLTVNERIEAGISPAQLAQVRPQDPAPGQEPGQRQDEPRQRQDQRQDPFRQDAPRTLPETAGLGALLGLLGLGAMGASATLGVALKRRQ